MRLFVVSSPFYRRERTVKIITAFQVATNSTAEKACQTRKSGFFNKIKRSKTTLLRALPIKLDVQVFRMSEACRTNEAEKVEFSRLSIIRLKVYSARKEGRTDPQAGIVTAIAESSLCFIV